MKNNLLVLVLISLLFCSCGGKKNNENSSSDSLKVDTVENVDKLVLNHFYNDIARFVAGMPLDESSFLKKYTEKNEWKEYASNIDKSWNNFEKEKLDVIETWVGKEFEDINKNTKNVFYPFSGPDFVYMYSFLPNAENYFMVALEPVGKIPNIEKIDNNMNSFFGALNNAIRDNLNLSFFITKNMKGQMNNAQIKGTIPVLLFFMARMNLHIQDIVPASISKDGKMSLSSNDKESADKAFTHGVEISFVKSGEKKISKLYYFSVSIRNDGFEAMPEAETFIKSLPTDMTTIVKSSSYCMHEDKYNKIRDMVLSHSKYLIQDDSGVPYRFFNQNDWTFNYYGVYTKPIPVFAHFYQDDMRKIWPQNNTKLNFRFGYNAESNIIVAKRK
ncbi:MAG: hypothetical protein GX259_06510 [Bacteroidales bacterium]|nr:hypothetical protein [Bacteroidales bacterium]